MTTLRPMVAMFAAMILLGSTACTELPDDRSNTTLFEGASNDGKPAGGVAQCFKVCAGPLLAPGTDPAKPAADTGPGLCKTFCPPGPGCTLLCSAQPHRSCSGSPEGDVNCKPDEALFAPSCRWQCPQPPPCERRCDHDCIQQLGQDGTPKDLVADKCCTTTCPPPPPPCAGTQCNPECVQKLVQAGVSESEARAKCCGDDRCPPPPPPPCPVQCDQQCIASFASSSEPVDERLIKEKCCKPECPPPPPPPCTLQCDQQCVEAFKSSGSNLDESLIKEKCCKETCDPNVPPPPPPPPWPCEACVQQCSADGSTPSNVDPDACKQCLIDHKCI